MADGATRNAKPTEEQAAAGRAALRETLRLAAERREAGLPACPECAMGGTAGLHWNRSVTTPDRSDTPTSREPGEDPSPSGSTGSAAPGPGSPHAADPGSDAADPGSDAAGPGSDAADPDRFDQLCVVADQLQALLSCTSKELCSVIAEVDEQGSFALDGCTSIETWVTARCGVHFSTARRWVAVARGLAGLPRIAQRFSEGRFSFDQVSELVGFATAETDESLAEEAQGLSPVQLRTLARSSRPRTPREALEDHRQRFLTLHHEAHGVALRGWLTADQGQLVESALHKVAERPARPEPAPDDPEPLEAYPVRLADALSELCAQDLPVSSDVPRAELVLHVGLTDLAGDETVAQLEGHGPVAMEVARRLGCDADVSLSADDAAGRPLGLGRSTRTIPRWLRRYLRQRDTGCRFPGCGRTRWVHAHHLVHWSKDGPTEISNLALQCVFHHHLLHEGGWRTEGDPNGVLTYISPTGRRLSSRPNPLRVDVEARVFAERAGPPTAGRHRTGARPDEEGPAPPGREPPDRTAGAPGARTVVP